MMITTRLGIELPIIQAPMAGIGDSALALAVCNAGGLGSLPCAMQSPDAIRSEVAIIRSQTSAPFNLNFFCHETASDPAREQQWKEALLPYYREFGLSPDEVPSAPARKPFDQEMLEVLLEINPAVASFHFGLPDAAALRRIKSQGIKILCSATSLAEAVVLADAGVDAIIAQGAEAGGHRGMFLESEVASQVGTFALVPQIVAAVEVPVIAAGGIATPEGVRAALSLGASAVQVGTAYMLCPESNTSDIHRATIASPASLTTAITNVFTGRPARAIVNRLVREQGPMSHLVPPFPTAAAPVAPLRAASEREGAGDFSAMWCGQNAAGCDDIPAAELTRQLMALL